MSKIFLNPITPAICSVGWVIFADHFGVSHYVFAAVCWACGWAMATAYICLFSRG